MQNYMLTLTVTRAIATKICQQKPDGGGGWPALIQFVAYLGIGQLVL